MDDGGSQFAGRSGVAVWFGELREVHVVVENLPGIVEDASRAVAHDVLKRLACPLRCWQQGVEVIHVGLEMLSVVEGDGLCADDGFEVADGVRQFDKLELTSFWHSLSHSSWNCC